MRRSHTARYDMRDLVLIAREACGTDALQLETLDRHLSYGWTVNKVSGFDGAPKIIFMQLKRTNGTYAIICIMPYGRVERPNGNNKTLRVTLPK